MNDHHSLTFSPSQGSPLKVGSTRQVTPQQTNYEPSEPVKEWLVENNYLPPYSFVEGMGWYATTLNVVMPILVELPLDLRVYEADLRTMAR